jgi:hypothetical protein
MSTAEANEMADILTRIKTWSVPSRVTLARRILESVEGKPAIEPSPHTGSLKDLLGILKTDAPAPNDEECQAILEEELIKKHLK